MHSSHRFKRSHDYGDFKENSLGKLGIFFPELRESGKAPEKSSQRDKDAIAVPSSIGKALLASGVISRGEAVMPHGSQAMQLHKPGVPTLEA